MNDWTNDEIFFWGGGIHFYISKAKKNLDGLAVYHIVVYQILCCFY